MDKKDILKQEHDYFLQKLKELLSDDNKKGKIALIKDKKIQGIYSDIEEAITAATQEKGYELETFLVQKIEKQKTHYISRIA